MQPAVNAQPINIATFNRISVALNTSLDLEKVYDQIMHHIGDIVPHRASSLIMIEDKFVRLVRSQSESDHVLFDPQKPLPLNQLPYLRDHMTARQAVRSLDIPQTTPFDQMPWVQAWAMAPIKLNQQLLGFIVIFTDDVQALQCDELDYLQAFADQAAIAITNAQTYDKLESFTQELNSLYHATSFLLSASNLTELGQQIAQAVIEEFALADCGVLLIDHDSNTINRLARAGNYGVQTLAPLYLNGLGLVPEAIRQGTIIYVPDVTLDQRYAPNVPQTHSELVIPLHGREQIIGVLDLQSAEINAFSERDQRILATFAKRAASALDNVMLYETLRQYAIDREQQVINRTQELHSAKERVETILNSTSDAISLMSADGRIDQSNQAFYDLFGYYYDEEFNWPLTRLVAQAQQDTLAAALQSALEQRQSQRLEATAIRKDGSPFEADLVISPVHKRSDDDDAWGLVCSLRDISQRKQVERELRSALARERELHELKTRFVSTASHEFRTPLATIMATLGLLRNYGDRMDEAKKLQQFEKIDNQIHYMTDLMDGVLTLGRMDAGKHPVKLEPLALDQLCAELVEEFQATMPQHPVINTCTGDPQPMTADHKLMREIIINLLTNAAKYSPPTSKIYLDLQYQPDQITVKVRDNGIGIPVSDQQHLFEAFHRAENVGTAPGTGLGLTIVKNAVDAHHGTIQFESQVNQGTTFTVIFPLHQEE